MGAFEFWTVLEPVYGLGPDKKSALRRALRTSLAMGQVNIEQLGPGEGRMRRYGGFSLWATVKDDGLAVCRVVDSTGLHELSIPKDEGCVDLSMTQAGKGTGLESLTRVIPYCLVRHTPSTDALSRLVADSQSFTVPSQHTGPFWPEQAEPIKH